MGKSCEAALDQIREKNYVQRVESAKEILLAGINYEKETKRHQCKIERWK